MKRSTSNDSGNTASNQPSPAPAQSNSLYSPLASQTKPQASTPSFPQPTLSNQSKPAFTSAATSILTPVPKASDPISRTKSNDHQLEASDDIISDNIKDDYEDDFENIEESNRLKKNAANNKRNMGGFGSGKGSGEPEESSGGFDEKYDEDFF
jgi:hypothetical protein